MKRVVMALAVGLALGVAGCGGDEVDETEAFCNAFVGPAPVWTACDAGCALANEGNAYDGDLDTTTTIVPQPGQTTYTTKLTATSTADIPSGAVAGVFLTQPAGSNFQTMTTSMRTIRDGVQRETLGPANEVIAYPGGTAAAGFLGMNTTQAFDQLELTVTVTWTGAQVPNYSVYEICADGGGV